MSKEEGFYVQEMHSYTNALGRIGTSVCSVEVVPTETLLFCDDAINPRPEKSSRGRL